MARSVARRSLLGSALIVSLAAPVALAQMGGGGGAMGSGAPGAMGGGRMGRGMMGGQWNMPRYLDALRTRLAITPEQEGLWKEYADTVSGVGEQMQGLHQTMFEAMGTATWEERQQMMNQMFQARQQAARTVHEAAVTLVAGLTPEQKTQAETMLPGLASRPGMMR